MTLESEASPLDSSLKRRLRRTTRRHRLRAFALTLPLLAFILLFFALPLVDMMAEASRPPRGEHAARDRGGAGGLGI